MIPLVIIVEIFWSCVLLALALSISLFMSQILYIISICWYVLNRLVDCMHACMEVYDLAVFQYNFWVQCFNFGWTYNYHELWHTWHCRHYYWHFTPKRWRSSTGCYMYIWQSHAYILCNKKFSSASGNLLLYLISINLMCIFPPSKTWSVLSC